MINKERRTDEHPEWIPEGGDRRRLPSRIPLLDRFRRQSRLIKSVAVGLSVAVIVTAAGWTVMASVSQNRRIAEQNSILSKTICEESNKLRDAERGLWALVIQLAAENPNPNIPKATRDKQVAQFRQYLDTAFAHIDCDDPKAIGGVRPPPALSFPVVTRVVENTKTKTRTVFITIPQTRTRTRIICQLPNGRRCP